MDFFLLHRYAVFMQSCFSLTTSDSYGIVMGPTLRTIMNSSYYYEYRENIHLGVELTPASVSRVWLRARIWPSAGWLTHHFLRPQGVISSGFYLLSGGGLLLGAWGSPADGAERIFGITRRVWASALWPEPP